MYIKQKCAPTLPSLSLAKGKLEYAKMSALNTAAVQEQRINVRAIFAVDSRHFD